MPFLDLQVPGRSVGCGRWRNSEKCIAPTELYPARMILPGYLNLLSCAWETQFLAPTGSEPLCLEVPSFMVKPPWNPNPYHISQRQATHAVHKLRFTEAPETCFFPFLGLGETWWCPQTSGNCWCITRRTGSGLLQTPYKWGGKLAIFVPIILQIGWSNPVVYGDCS